MTIHHRPTGNRPAAEHASRRIRHKGNRNSSSSRKCFFCLFFLSGGSGQPGKAPTRSALLIDRWWTSWKKRSSGFSSDRGMLRLPGHDYFRTRTSFWKMEVIATVRRNSALCFRSCLKRSQPKAEITSHTASLVRVTEKKITDYNYNHSIEKCDWLRRFAL